MRTWKQQYQIKKDKSQTKLMLPISKLKQESTVTFNYEKLEIEVFCPFCCHTEKLTKFLTIETKKGKSNYKAECPECNTTLLTKTLLENNKKTWSEFAKWCYEYSASGFWQKVKWEKFRVRINPIFWEEYKKIKGYYNENQDSNQLYDQYIQDNE